MFRKSVFGFFYLLFACLQVNAQQAPLKFSYLTVDEGLSHTDAKDIKQDKRGFIWIATLFGLDRYDGYTIKRFYNSNVPKNNAFKNRVRSIYPDDDGNIWLATDGGIQCFDARTETYIDFDAGVNSSGQENFSDILLYKNHTLAVRYQDKIMLFSVSGSRLTNIPLQLPWGVVFTDMLADDMGDIWLSSNKGVWVLNSRQKLWQLQIINGPRGYDLAFTKIYMGRDNNLVLVSADTKVFSLNRRAQQLQITAQYTSPGGSHISDVLQDKKHNYWISTDAGLLYLDNKLQLKQLITNKSFTNSLNTNYLDKLFIDRSECLWVCTFGGGVNYCDLNAKLFHTFQHNPEVSNTLSGNYVRSILEENSNTLWVGTNASGLNKYDFLTGRFQKYTSDNGPAKLKSDEVNAVAFDNDHNLWLGTDKGIDILNVKTNRLEKPADNEKLPLYSINTLTKDCYGNMWFGDSNDNLGCIQYHKNAILSVKYFGYGHYIWADKQQPELFIASTNGLRRLIINSTGEVVKTYTYNTSDKLNSLSSNYTWPIQRQNDSTYWIGTLGGGLDRLILRKNNTCSIKTFGSAYGIFNDVESLEIDKSGNIWMGGNGLECFNPKTLKLVRYDKNDGLQGNSFKVGSSYKGIDGRLYFGGINGLNYFYPDSIKGNKIAAMPVITDLIVNNRKVEIGKANTVLPGLKQVISFSNSLELNYLQNNFVITFSAMHFANALNCIYRYKLVGFDKDWKYTDGVNPTAAYSNLDYNKYTFIVEATNNDGIWSSHKATVLIEVTPPWWKSTTAEVIYFMLFLSGLIGVYIYQARWYRLKREMAVRDVEEQKREEMHHQREELYQQQLQFFTNISHEFRTPLTLIMGPLENLIKENMLSAFNHSYQVMHRNAKRLVNLINELMNFRKVADSVIKLQVRPVAISRFIDDLADEFNDLAISKDIEFPLIKNEDELSNWFDLQIVEKILFNLLNNSFKYTPVGGKVALEVFFSLEQFKPAYETEFKLLNDYRAARYVYFRVFDSGIGISKESIGQIFDRYYRISNNHLGSGVGLSLVKSLTLLHKGDIYVYSERNKGTEIIIALPWGEENYLAGEKSNPDGLQAEFQLEKLDNTILSPLTLTNFEKQGDLTHADASKKRILLVEDNDELRLFLKEVLQPQYCVYEASDGKEGLELAIEKTPDLVLSDVMMPAMNGVELCRQLKDNFETSHIPFMILSAKDALDARIEGMESGADYYFSKPLSTELLLLTIHNLFEQKQKLKNKYTKDYYAEATELVHSAKDKEFMDKLLAIIEANMQKPELDVDYLCRQLYTSRTKLYQKINSISGQSVGEFIRTIRLKKAVHIMTHEDVSLNEVIDRIGLQSNSYFSRAFKKEFGKSPSQFLQTLKVSKAESH